MNYLGAIYELIHRASLEYPYIEVGFHCDNYMLHFHNEIELIYIKEGSIPVQINQDIHVLVEDDICIVMPNQAHTIYPKEYNNVYIIKILPFQEFDVVTLPKSIFNKDDYCHSEILNYLFSIVKEDNEKKIGYEMAVQNSCNGILLYLLRNLSQEYSTLTKVTKNKCINDLINNVDKYLKSNYSKKITLEEVSNACNYNKYYFCKLFKKVTSINFSEYCNSFKINKSIEYLKTKNYTMEEISYKCGFASVRSFSRVFRSCYNTSPGNYRKFMQQSTNFNEKQKETVV